LGMMVLDGLWAMGWTSKIYLAGTDMQLRQATIPSHPRTKPATISR
jgi:hypothetical protein